MNSAMIFVEDVSVNSIYPFILSPGWVLTISPGGWGVADTRAKVPSWGIVLSPSYMSAIGYLLITVPEGRDMVSVVGVTLMVGVVVFFRRIHSFRTPDINCVHTLEKLFLIIVSVRCH